MISAAIDSDSVESVSYVPPGGQEEEKEQRNVAKVGWQTLARAQDTPARCRNCQHGDRQSMCKKESNTAKSRWNDTFIYTGRHERGHGADNADRSRLRPQNTAVKVVLRTISPTFGATSFETFDTRHDTKSSRMIVMLANVIWPIALGNAASLLWFQDFCTSPLLYHAHSVAGATYRDFLAKNLLWSDRKTTLAHRGNAVSLIREQFARIDFMPAQDVEKLIFAMIILGGNEPQTWPLVEMDLPFRPHIALADPMRILGHSKPVMAYQNAAFALVHRQGGLHELRASGLALIIAIADMLNAASNLHHPVFPCYRNAHVVDALPENIDDEEFLTSARRPGIGFFKLPGGLPHLAASVLAEVACLDRIMSTFHERNPKGQELVTLLDARSATVHRLLSLPSWAELARQSQEDSHRAIYETCRVTAVIYCNAVILPIPAHSGWNDRLTAILVDILTTAKFETGDVNVSALRIWALLIGGIAAQGTAQRSLFENALKRWYAAHGGSWSAIVESLKEFIWSDRACKAAGATLLHRALFGSSAP
ncbi:hypothetical protein DOTSEDRAFT_70011 [Dothistroma septosporum NZE10]|uniref:Uncharacterized protein n=1 Tax=Dothistroma septosporum (strain NZE10 / CBS 128990) TaxID=675120 RepID=N1Q1A5_DOTSN|nr:hypothetical protein DOTSEDRAFT_70011 [Dothistroma septosporum NZE10]